MQRMKFLTRITTLAALLLLPACTIFEGGSSGPTALHTEKSMPAGQTDLINTEWVVEDIAGRGIIDNSHVTLLFAPDGRLSGSASCNRLIATYTTDGAKLEISKAGLTMMACPPALMEQERRFVDALGAVTRYQVDETGALVLSMSDGKTIKAYPASTAAQETSYFCADKSLIKASYPTTDTARVVIGGETIDMRIARSASGARYVGGGWQWWTKGMTEGTLAKLEPGESIASARGLACTAR
jgi:heat shock protein HslJ